MTIQTGGLPGRDSGKGIVAPRVWRMTARLVENVI
jgi:hypothetical protein